MKTYQTTLAILTTVLAMTAADLASAAPLLFLKGDKLYALNESLEPVMVTSQVTKVVPQAGLFLKGDRLYRLTNGLSYEYVTQQVSAICDDARFIVKQSSRLYVLDANYETSYITAGVTSCNSN